MKVKSLRKIILDKVRLVYEIGLESGRVDNYYLNAPCFMDDLPDEYMEYEVKSIFSLDIVDLLYIEVKHKPEPELPFSEEVTE